MTMTYAIKVETRGGDFGVYAVNQPLDEATAAR